MRQLSLAALTLAALGLWGALALARVGQLRAAARPSIVEWPEGTDLRVGWRVVAFPLDRDPTVLVVAPGGSVDEARVELSPADAAIGHPAEAAALLITQALGLGALLGVALGSMTGERRR